VLSNIGKLSRFFQEKEVAGRGGRKEGRGGGAQRLNKP